MATRPANWKNPLDALASPAPANWPNNFRIPQIPKLSESMAGRKLVNGFAAHDTALEVWRQSTEKSIDERISQALSPQSTTTTEAPAVTATAPAPPPVVSVNGKIGAVRLTTDDVPEGTVNFYMTSSRWQSFYDQYGFARNLIESNVTIFIPPNRNQVICGPLTVLGQFLVEGYFLALPAP